MSNGFQVLGLAMRAGKLVSGEEIVLQEVRAGRAHLVVLATDTARSTEKKITDKCTSYHVPVLRYGTLFELGKAIGKAERVVIAIKDQGFSRLLSNSWG